MITVCLILVAVFAVVVVIGGAAMVLNGENVFDFWCGSRAIEAGFKILGAVLPAIVEGIAGMLSDN